VILLSAGVFEAARKIGQATATKPGAPPSYTGPTYPGMITLDHIANGLGQVEDYGFTVTATNVRRSAGDFGQQLVCVDVTYLNRNSTNGDYDFIADWKLQQPNGLVSYSDLVADTSPGRLLIGASTSGKTCFDDTGQHGQFVLIWHPLVNPRADRGIWLFTLP